MAGTLDSAGGTTGVEVGLTEGTVAGGTVEFWKVTGFSSHRVQTVVLVRVMVLVWVTGMVKVVVPEVTVDEVTGNGQQVFNNWDIGFPLVLTRAGRGHNGDGLGGRARLHRSVRRLGGGGARGSGRVRSGVSSSRGGARGGGGLGASRVSGSRVSGSRTSRGGAGSSPRRVALALGAPFLNSRGRADVVSTTSLHDTGEGRAGKSQESHSVDHFERLKVFLCLITRNLGNSNE